jgi:hypothetical protein
VGVTGHEARQAVAEPLHDLLGVVVHPAAFLHAAQHGPAGHPCVRVILQDRQHARTDGLGLGGKGLGRFFRPGFSASQRFYLALDLFEFGRSLVYLGERVKPPLVQGDPLLRFAPPLANLTHAVGAFVVHRCVLLGLRTLSA